MFTLVCEMMWKKSINSQTTVRIINITHVRCLYVHVDLIRLLAMIRYSRCTRIHFLFFPQQVGYKPNVCPYHTKTFIHVRIFRTITIKISWKSIYIQCLIISRHVLNHGREHFLNISLYIANWYYRIIIIIIPVGYRSIIFLICLNFHQIQYI